MYRLEKEPKDHSKPENEDREKEAPKESFSDYIRRKAVEGAEAEEVDGAGTVWNPVIMLNVEDVSGNIYLREALATGAWEVGETKLDLRVDAVIPSGSPLISVGGYTYLVKMGDIVNAVIKSHLQRMMEEDDARDAEEAEEG